MASETKFGLTISVENNIQIIRFNNPRKRNAIHYGAYRSIKNALEEAAKSPDIFLTVLTGTGGYYSSGFDITNAGENNNPENARQDLTDMIDAIIDYPKLLVAIVNGPAIGLAVTILGLCDIVYASENATFMTPFSKLGLCAEGCASYTFPQILGKSKANEILLVGHKMSAEEALQFGFISKIYKNNEINKIWNRILEFKNMSQQSIQITKKLTRNFDKDVLHQTNKEESEQLKVCLQSEDFGNAVLQFLSRKSKL